MMVGSWPLAGAGGGAGSGLGACASWLPLMMTGSSAADAVAANARPADRLRSDDARSMRGSPRGSGLTPFHTRHWTTLVRILQGAKPVPTDGNSPSAEQEQHPGDRPAMMLA